MATNWAGIFPAATTQFHDDESLDMPSTLRHYDVLLKSGIHGLIVLGTVGENTSLEMSEKVDLVRTVVEHVNGRVPVLTGVAEFTTAQACRFSAAAQDAGADGIMLLPGMGYKSDSRETIQHFRRVAAAVDLPIMCYNNPVTYGVDLTPEMFDEMADEPRFVAIKESSDNPRRITDLFNRLGDRYKIFSGVDDLVFESVMLGACGWVSGLVNAFPAENRLLWDLLMAEKYDEARAVYRWYTPLLHLDTHVKLVQYIKLAMSECGLGAETHRGPRLPLTGPERTEIIALVRKAIATSPASREAAELQRSPAG
jgi:dihydrodipicolinate synthase/N-acetylneuraminate lyase